MTSPHKITTYECIYEDEELIEERLLSITRMNKDGKVVHRERYDLEGNLIKREEFQYVGEHVIQSIEEDLIEEQVNKTICEYQDDKLMNQKEYFNDALSIEMNYVYSDNGQLLENIILNSDGSPNSKYTYEYLDRKTTEKFYDEEMTLVNITETTVDEQGQIIEKRITEIYEDREVTNAQKVVYNVNEDETTKNYYNNGVEAFEVIESFDEEGRIVESAMYDVAKDEEQVTSLEYDERGLVTKEEITKDEEVISLTNVVFDKYGNRVELIKHVKVAEDYSESAIYKFVNEYGEGE